VLGHPEGEGNEDSLYRAVFERRLDRVEVTLAEADVLTEADALDDQEEEAEGVGGINSRRGLPEGDGLIVGHMVSFADSDAEAEAEGELESRVDLDADTDEEAEAEGDSDPWAVIVPADVLEAEAE
jgi:hypothetical protein